MNDFNTQVIEEFRANRGVVGGHFEKANLLLLHTVGRKTGTERVTPLLYLADGDAFVLVGSNGGAEREPAWVANVAAMSEVPIEVGERSLTTRPTILRDGPERARLYERLYDYWPDVRQYETNTDRPFPLIRLDPVD
jgi:deazaflavin-dependent oxidoreductase (nitroreductase family)